MVEVGSVEGGKEKKGWFREVQKEVERVRSGWAEKYKRDLKKKNAE